MQQFIRIMCSGFISFLITASLFIGMMKLLGGHGSNITTQNLDFKISYVQAEEAIKHRKRQKRKPPEKQQASQPPAAPKLQVAPNEVTKINIASEFNSAKRVNILGQTQLSGFTMNTGQINIGTQGGIKAGIPPIYPPKAVLNNIEGWVLVNISVNQLGQVSEVVVLDAMPVRLFEDAAIKAVKKWAFYPKKIDGQSVPYQLKQKIEFKIDPIEESD